MSDSAGQTYRVVACSTPIWILPEDVVARDADVPDADVVAEIQGALGDGDEGKIPHRLRQGGANPPVKSGIIAVRGVVDDREVIHYGVTYALNVFPASATLLYPTSPVAYSHQKAAASSA